MSIRTKYSYQRITTSFCNNSLKLKTFGRVIDLFAIKADIRCLESLLSEAEKSFNLLWQTASYLQEKMSTAKESLEWLKRRETEQQMLRWKHARRPIAPEITSRILSHIPISRDSQWLPKEGYRIYTKLDASGLVPLIIYNPSLMAPHYRQDDDDDWPLEEIFGRMDKIERSVLNEAAWLKKEFKSCFRYYGEVSDPQPFMNYPHQWKRLECSGGNTYAFESHPVHLEELDVPLELGIASNRAVLQSKGTRLETAYLLFNHLSFFFNSGILDSITRLTLHSINDKSFSDCSDAWKKALHELPDMLSQLPCLNEFITEVPDTRDFREQLSLAGSVNSASLRSLNVEGWHVENVFTFLKLFANCRIDSIEVKCDLNYISRSESLENVRRIHIKVRSKVY